MVNSTFTKEQFSSIYPEGIELHYWNHARNRIINKFLLKQGLKNNKILEIGCGRGIVLQFLRAKGYNCIGVELASVEPVSGTKGYIYPGTDAFDLPIEIREGIDAILLLDVIEHLEYPAEFIRKIRNEFVKLKHLIITVPAREELWTNYDEYNGHFRRYSLIDLKGLSGTGINLTKAGYFIHLLYPVFWMVARLLKNRETMIKAPSGIQLVFHRVISFVLQVDYDILPPYIPGTSIIAIFSLNESQAVG